MSSRSLLLQLPRDILHSVYSEWLSSWRDLSRLDAGCVGQGDREAWLCSLSELRMREELPSRRTSGESMRRCYEWVISRKVVLVERFPVWLCVLSNFPAQLDFGSYCPSIRSIEIQNNFYPYYHSHDSSLLNVFAERVYLFVRECVHLKGVRYFESGHFAKLDDLVLSALQRGLNRNTLLSICISIQIPFSTSQKRTLTSTENTIVQLLTDHLSSMLDFKITARYTTEGFVDAIMSVLREKRSPLKRLGLLVDRISWQKLLVCLSSVGVHLETLEVKGDYMPTTTEYVKGEVLSTLGISCPQLRRFELSAHKFSDAIPMSNIYQLYELCPKLISVDYSSLIVIDVNDQDVLKYRWCPNRLSREEKGMFLQCICLAIKRSPCELTISSRDFCYDLIDQYDDWVLFKSNLSPYVTDMDGVMSESILIEAVKELPRLEKLVIDLEEEKLSDLSLAAIREYGYGLKRLKFYNANEYIPEQCSFSDEMISKVIRGCEMLEELRIPCAGYESVLAVKHHSRLRSVCLYGESKNRRDVKIAFGG